MAITKVWIEDGCIVCNACEAECADVFHVTAETCMIRGESRQDGAEDENRVSKNPLKVEVGTSLEASIKAAAAGCPVSHLESGSVIVEEFEAVASAEPAKAAESAAEAPAAGTAPEPAAAVAVAEDGGLPAKTGYVWDIKAAPGHRISHGAFRN